MEDDSLHQLWISTCMFTHVFLHPLKCVPTCANVCTHTCISHTEMENNKNLKVKAIYRKHHKYYINGEKLKAFPVIQEQEIID